MGAPDCELCGLLMALGPTRPLAGVAERRERRGRRRAGGGASGGGWRGGRLLCSASSYAREQRGLGRRGGGAVLDDGRRGEHRAMGWVGQAASGVAGIRARGARGGGREQGRARGQGAQGAHVSREQEERGKKKGEGGRKEKKKKKKGKRRRRKEERERKKRESGGRRDSRRRSGACDGFGGTRRTRNKENREMRR